ncbi:unnamed protein product [Dovyalis caffra]|uniref:Uncharacterized protein n=1 Tax=Dovyalis caffra TaxID=77055 RepID=A0AAV1QTQ0_9ROSI|nr:unnamed protein product [Dovyalis caffra]
MKALIPLYKFHSIRSNSSNFTQDTNPETIRYLDSDKAIAKASQRNSHERNRGGFVIAHILIIEAPKSVANSRD